MARMPRTGALTVASAGLATELAEGVEGTEGAPFDGVLPPVETLLLTVSSNWQLENVY